MTVTEQDIQQAEKRMAALRENGFAGGLRRSEITGLDLGAPWESLQYYPLRDFWRDGKQMISA